MKWLYSFCEKKNYFYVMHVQSHQKIFRKFNCTAFENILFIILIILLSKAGYNYIYELSVSFTIIVRMSF